MFDAILQAPFIIQFHLIAAVEALILGPFVLYRRRRDRLHKILGYIWVTNMALAALSSFFIRDLKMIGDFSPIHVMSVMTILFLWQAIRAARQGDTLRHRGIMQGLYWCGLVAAGALSFLPGRIMSRTFLSMPPLMAAIFVLVLLTLFILLLRMQSQLGPLRANKKPGRERPGQVDAAFSGRSI